MNKDELAYPSPVMADPQGRGLIFEQRDYGVPMGMTYGDLAFLHVFAAMIMRGEDRDNALALTEHYLAVLP